jgi:hypothetical protein
MNYAFLLYCPRYIDQPGPVMRQLILCVVLMSVWTAVPAQDSTEVPNPPAIPSEEERAKAEEAARAYEARQKTPEPHGNAPYGPRERKTVEGSTSVTEYSRSGHVYSLKIKPGKAPTQYVDAPGDGQLEPPTNEDLPENYNLPKWRVGSW